MNIHEPRRKTKGIRKLTTKLAEDPAFASIVFDLRETMDQHLASPTDMRDALRLMLHTASWQKYIRLLNDVPLVEEQEDVDVEEDDPLEI